MTSALSLTPRSLQLSHPLYHVGQGDSNEHYYAEPRVGINFKR